MKNRVITISREFGSGGRTIGRTASSTAFMSLTRISAIWST